MFLMLVLLQVDFHLFYPPDFALAHAHLSSAPASSIRVILIRCAPCTRVWQVIHNYPPLRSAPPLSALATILNSPTFPPSRHPHPPSSFTLTAAKSYAVKTVPQTPVLLLLTSSIFLTGTKILDGHNFFCRSPLFFKVFSTRSEFYSITNLKYSMSDFIF